MATTKVTTGGITDATVATVDIADQAVTLAKLEHGTSSNDGKFLRANNGADPTFESLPQSGISEVSSDSTPQLGGDLDTNGHEILLDDAHAVKFGAGEDLQIYHEGGSGDNVIKNNVAGKHLKILQANNDAAAVFYNNTSVALFNAGAKKFETTANGIIINDRFEMRNGTIFDNTANGNNCGLSFNGDGVRPTSGSGADIDNARDLGQTSYRWRNVYAVTYYGDGSNLTGVEGVPSGVIAIWSGATNAIPSGWVLCNGSNSTPDLRDRFVVGAGNSYSVGNTGGATSNSTQVSVNGNTGWASQFANASSSPSMSPEPFNSRDRHQHSWGGTFTTSSFGILPPYYALAYIMKT